MHLLKYERETGTIIGVWTATTQAVLEANIVPDDPVYGFLLDEGELDWRTLQDTYQVQAGVLVPRPPQES
jgi:hypothetical protein